MAGPALLTGPTGPADPRHAYPPVCALDDSDDLVAKDPRGVLDLDLAIKQVQVGTTDPARQHPEENLSRAWFRNRPVFEHQRLTHAVEHHRAHGRRQAHGTLRD
jgi:hypothetical protein